MSGEASSVSRRAVGALSALAALGLCVALVLATAAGAVGARSSRQRLVVSPRPGQTVPARPLAIRVRTGATGGALRVRLNGQAIGRYFSPATVAGVRTLSASATFGLRPGANVLAVEARGPHGSRRSRVVRFQVRGNRPLVGAGFDQDVAVGSRFYLNGRRPATGAISAGAGMTPIGVIRHRWTIVGGPAGASSKASLRGPASAPYLVARRPGTYVLELRAWGSDGREGSDLLDVRADPAPAAAVDTMAFPHGATQSGIEVGDAFYPSKRYAWAQLVTLDRKTLEPVGGKLAGLADKDYFCKEADTSVAGACDGAHKELTADLAKLGHDDLVIVSSPYATAGRAPYGVWPIGVESALARIGVSETGFDQDEKLDAFGGISAIGIPGTAPGKGDWHAVVSTRNGAGAMHGYLIRNNEGDYVYAAPDQAPYDTQAPGSNAQTNVVELGDHKFSQPLEGVFGGFQVVVADPQTLEGKSYWFSTAEGRPKGVEAALTSMREVLKAANESGDKLVVIESRGLPAVQSGAASAEPSINSTLQSLVDQIEQLGGTRNGAFDALDPGLSHATSYTLVGSSKAGAANGEETTAGGTSRPSSGFGMNTSPLSGTMARTGPNYGFRPQGVPAVGEQAHGGGPEPAAAATELDKVLVQPPSAWPEAGNAGRAAAIQWIGRQVFGTSDPRAQYWTVIYKPDVWNGYAGRIGALAYPGDASFTAADLTWAKEELQREIGWLENVHNYLENLSAPFSKTQLQSWAAFEAIANSVRDRVGVGVDQRTMATQQALWASFRTLLSAAGPAAHAFHAADAVYETVMQFVEINNEPAEDEFQGRADELGQQLAERLTAEQEMLTRQIPNAIAVDYQKLRAVGSCTSSDPKEWSACPFDHADWQFTQDDQAEAAKILLPGLKTWAYGSLLSARYTLWRLPPWWQTKASREFRGYTFPGILFHPFDGLPGSAQVAKPLYRNIPSYSHVVRRSSTGWYSTGETWQVYALGYLSGDGTITDRWLMHYPQADVTDPIFKPLAQGGLGADPESFFDHYFTPKSLDHYPERDTPTGWCWGEAPCE